MSFERLDIILTNVADGQERNKLVGDKPTEEGEEGLAK